MEMLASMFDLSLDELENNIRPPHEHLENPFGPDAPDIAFDEEGKAVLTDLGRYEVINNIKKLPVVPNTYPEMQPIRTFENAFLVRSLHKVSNVVNVKYGRDLEILCAQPSLVGSVARNYLRPSYDNSPSVNVKEWQLRKAHFSLRVFAHYRTLFYIFMYFMFCKLFGISYPRGIFIAIVFFVIFSMLKAVMIKRLRGTESHN